jgi:hypothetical protein
MKIELQNYRAPWKGLCKSWERRKHKKQEATKQNTKEFEYCWQCRFLNLLGRSFHSNGITRGSAQLAMFF